MYIAPLIAGTSMRRGLGGAAAHPSTAGVPIIVLLYNGPFVEFYLYPTVSTALVHSVKPKLTE